MKKKLRLYLDTSVFGGYFDKEFEEHSIPVVEGIIKRQAHLLISSVVTDELAKAPTEVRDLILKIPDDALEFIAFSSEVKELTNQIYFKKSCLKKIFERCHPCRPCYYCKGRRHHFMEL